MRAKNPDQLEKESARPETIRLLLWLWAGAIGGEVVHQLLSMLMSFMDPAGLLAAAREQLSPEQREQLGDNLVRITTYTSILIMGALGIAIMGLLAFMLTLLARRSKHAGLARRMLMVFSFYFGFRILVLFMSNLGGSSIPVYLYAIDGALQILIGVAALCGLWLSFRSETLQWTREVPEKESAKD